MAYELHMKPPGYDHDDPSTHLALEDFQVAVAKIEDCRLHEDSANSDFPYAEVFFPGYRQWLVFKYPAEWLPVFCYGCGTVSFKAAFDIEDPDDPVRRAAAKLANLLGCRIKGDGGELYSWEV